MIIENGTKNIRMGWKNSFIKKIILNDGTEIENMQCNLSATLPTDEELDKIDKYNLEDKEKKVFDEFQRKECEFEEITDMLWLIYEDYYGIKTKDLYEKANNFERLERYLINIHSLLYLRKQEMTKFIDEVYAERKGRGNDL
jgi:hypothetical protein